MIVGATAYIYSTDVRTNHYKLKCWSTGGVRRRVMRSNKSSGYIHLEPGAQFIKPLCRHTTENKKKKFWRPETSCYISHQSIQHVVGQMTSAKENVSLSFLFQEPWMSKSSLIDVSNGCQDVSLEYWSRVNLLMAQREKVNWARRRKVASIWDVLKHSHYISNQPVQHLRADTRAAQ